MTIPGFTSTGSKRPGELFGSNPGCPQRFVRAEGCKVWDEEGKEYNDLVMGLGAVALGYAHPDVNAAVEKAVRAGSVGPLPPVSEHDVAERLAAVIPGAEAVRFLKTGAEAVAAAVRIARVLTGRERVITCGYHGWLDWCQDGPGVPRAVGALRCEVPFNDSKKLEETMESFGPVAAVVIEPVVEREPDRQWLTAARELTRRSGSVLVFDEIKTAFRIAVGGAAERYGVVPDIAAVGKALGNGFPLAAICGSKVVMAALERTWISSTLATEQVSLAAALTVLDCYEDLDVVGELGSRGKELLEGLTRIANRFGGLHASAKGIPEMCFLDFGDPHVSAAFAASAASRGLIFKCNAYNFVSFAHTEEVLRAMMLQLEEAAEEVERKC